MSICGYFLANLTKSAVTDVMLLKIFGKNLRFVLFLLLKKNIYHIKNAKFFARTRQK
jgi:hypothetical protein